MIDLTVDALREILVRIEQAAPGTAAQAPRGPLRKTIAFLGEHNGKTVDELAAALELLKPPPKAVKSTVGTASAKPRKPKLPVQQQVVEDYLLRLNGAEHSLDLFAAVMAGLKADKKARIDELKEIVRSYSGDMSSIKSKPVALGVIQRAFDSKWNLRQHKEGLSAPA